MGKLSIYKPGKSKDYRFLDRVIGQQFTVGGTLIHVHMYLGTTFQGKTDDVTLTSDPDATESTIEDLLFLENRDRKYSQDIYELKSHYTLSDIDFNLTQFGITLNSSTIFMNFHINQMIDSLGRKLMAGDVIEIVHRRDDVVLDESIPYINAFYVIKDAARSAEGYSATWLPHIWRIRAEPITDSPEFKKILDQIVEDSGGKTVGDIISNGNITQQISDLIQQQANADVPTRNFNSAHLWIAPDGQKNPGDDLIAWVLNGDGVPPNQNNVAPSGRRFPENPNPGDYFLRTDYKPPRLFRRHDNKWCKAEDDWMDRPWTPATRTLEDFLNDDETVKLGQYPEDTINKRQPARNAVKPKEKLPKPPLGEEE